MNGSGWRRSASAAALCALMCVFTSAAVGQGVGTTLKNFFLYVEDASEEPRSRQQAEPPTLRPGEIPPYDADAT